MAMDRKGVSHHIRLIVNLESDLWKLLHLGIATWMSHPDSRSDPIGGSEPVSGCETIYWDSLLFFFRAELVPVGIQTISVITKILYIHKKTTIGVVSIKIYTHILSPIYLYKYLYMYISNTNIRDRGTVLVSTYL